MHATAVALGVAPGERDDEGEAELLGEVDSVKEDETLVDAVKVGEMLVVAATLGLTLELAVREGVTDWLGGVM